MKNYYCDYYQVHLHIELLICLALFKHKSDIIMKSVYCRTSMQSSYKRQKRIENQKKEKREEKLNIIEHLPSNVLSLINKYIRISEDGKVLEEGEKNTAKWACVSKTTYNEVKAMKIGDLHIKTQIESDLESELKSKLDSDTYRTMSFKNENNKNENEMIDNSFYLPNSSIPIFVSTLKMIIDISSAPSVSIYKLIKIIMKKLMKSIYIAVRLQNVIYEGKLQIVLHNYFDQPLNVMTWLSCLTSLQRFAYRSLEIIGPKALSPTALPTSLNQKYINVIHSKEIEHEKQKLLFLPSYIIIHNEYNSVMNLKYLKLDQLKKVEHIKMINHENSKIFVEYNHFENLLNKMPKLKLLTFQGHMDGIILSLFIPRTGLQQNLEISIENLSLTNRCLKNLLIMLSMTSTNIKINITGKLYMKIDEQQSFFKMINAFSIISSLEFKKNTITEFDLSQYVFSPNHANDFLHQIDTFVHIHENRLKNIASFRLIFQQIDKDYIYDLYHNFLQSIILKFPYISNFSILAVFPLDLLFPFPQLGFCNVFCNEFKEKLNKIESKLEKVHLEYMGSDLGFKRTYIRNI